MKDFREFRKRVKEEMDPRDHVIPRGDKFLVVGADGSTIKMFKDKAKADQWAIDNHDMLMAVESNSNRVIEKKVKNFKEFRELPEAARAPDTDEELDALAFLEDIDASVSTVKAEDVAINDKKTNSKRITIDQYMQGNLRSAFVAGAIDEINKSEEWNLVPVAPARAQKDFAFERDGGKLIYVNNRPTAGFKSDGDPNELMAAALMLLPEIKIPKTAEEMDEIIDEVKKVVSSGKVVGHTAGQVAGMEKNYGNLAQAISAATSLPKKYRGADKVYLTGQAWDKDVKQFQRTKYGMKDFNSSDYIVKKGNNFIGISLKKKMRSTESDPTLINKSFQSMLLAFEKETGTDSTFSKIKDQLETKIAEYYSTVLYENYKTLSPDVRKAIEKYIKMPRTKAIKALMGAGRKRPWKKFVGALRNDIINKSLVSQSSLFKDMDKILIDNEKLFANSLVQLIFKADLKDLKKVNFDFALVTGIGRYLKAGPTIEKGEYKDIDTMTTVLDDLFSNGEPSIKRDKSKKQAFDMGATAANLNYVLYIGSTPIVKLILRYKGNFSSSPSFQAEMTPEFKDLFY